MKVTLIEDTPETWQPEKDLQGALMFAAYQDIACIAEEEEREGRRGCPWMVMKALGEETGRVIFQQLDQPGEPLRSQGFGSKEDISIHFFKKMPNTHDLSLLPSFGPDLCKSVRNGRPDTPRIRQLQQAAACQSSRSRLPTVPTSNGHWVFGSSRAS